MKQKQPQLKPQLASIAYGQNPPPHGRASIGSVMTHQTENTFVGPGGATSVRGSAAVTVMEPQYDLEKKAAEKVRTMEFDVGKPLDQEQKSLKSQIKMLKVLISSLGLILVGLTAAFFLL